MITFRVNVDRDLTPEQAEALRHFVERAADREAIRLQQNAATWVAKRAELAAPVVGPWTYPAAPGHAEMSGVSDTTCEAQNGS